MSGQVSFRVRVFIGSSRAVLPYPSEGLAS